MNVLNGPSASAVPRAAKEAQLMVNPWNAMYNDRVGGIGDSVGNRAAASGEAGGGGGPAAWDLASNKYRWEAKFVPGASGGTVGFNPVAWVERYSPEQLAQFEQDEKTARQRLREQQEKKKGAVQVALQPMTPAELQAEKLREARCKELDAKLGVDKVTLNPQPLALFSHRTCTRSPQLGTSCAARALTMPPSPLPSPRWCSIR